MNKSLLKENKDHQEETIEPEDNTEDPEDPEKTEAQGKTEGQESTEDPEVPDQKVSKVKEDTILTDKDRITDLRTKKKDLILTYLSKENKP